MKKGSLICQTLLKYSIPSSSQAIEANISYSGILNKSNEEILPIVNYLDALHIHK